ncbi:hypothetical protein KSP35_13135 [Aquihabitans sp. G128]|uniref:hypothetical protein n=1 Tax=Aquihabitans sp. G128 TaxID=2849779 RepID=UPI001C2286B9|nr:hypothetical protein [Aquihabitans sp. G128]QXC59347.1 hypothetical protein KSP35_13135 [Aquihabitans sp. G128]
MTATAPVLAAGTWPTNGHLIEDVARLGYLRADWLTLDPTHGRGVWWSRWRPERLVAHDLDPAKAPDGPADFTDLPYPDGHFDAVTFDPPYMAPGGRKTTSVADFNDRFGLHATPARPDTNQAQIDAGLAECHRVVRRGGIVLVKCMDYVNGGQLFLGTHHTLTTALELGFRCEDRIEHVGRPGPQPSVNLDGSARRQLHAPGTSRRSSSSCAPQPSPSPPSTSEPPRDHRTVHPDRGHRCTAGRDQGASTVHGDLARQPLHANRERAALRRPRTRRLGVHHASTGEHGSEGLQDRRPPRPCCPCRTGSDGGGAARPTRGRPVDR